MAVSEKIDAIVRGRQGIFAEKDALRQWLARVVNLVMQQEVTTHLNAGPGWWGCSPTESVRLGEKVAIALLWDQRQNYTDFQTYDEPYTFRFQTFDGLDVEINNDTTRTQLENYLNR